MKVIVAEKLGFCPGVRNALNLAEEILKKQQKVYSLGPVIHNKDVVDRLAKKGLKTVNSIDEIDSGTVLIRSHGAAPGQIEKLKKKGLNIADATCILVKRVQQIARKLDADGYRVVVIGDRNHPEVRAVVGCGTDVIVVADRTDLDKLPSEGRLGIVSQTTEDPGRFTDTLCRIAKQGFSELKVINTLCREAIRRQQSAVEICKKVDIMFVLGGLQSANTRRLAELCKKYNSQTFHLQNFSDCDINLLSGKASAGVTAGASTPDWIIERFVDGLEKSNSRESSRQP